MGKPLHKCSNLLWLRWKVVTFLLQTCSAPLGRLSASSAPANDLHPRLFWERDLFGKEDPGKWLLLSGWERTAKNWTGRRDYIGLLGGGVFPGRGLSAQGLVSFPVQELVVFVFQLVRGRVGSGVNWSKMVSLAGPFTLHFLLWTLLACDLYLSNNTHYLYDLSFIYTNFLLGQNPWLVHTCGSQRIHYSTLQIIAGSKIFIEWITE